MQDQHPYDYAIIRVMPRVEREEFINAGVIVSCPVLNYLEAKVELNEEKLRAVYPDQDPEIIRQHLEIIPAICRGGEATGELGKLSKRERFHWLVSPRSTIIQTSPVHSGCSKDPSRVLEHLMNKMVR